jgi:hypothetical protein
MEKLQKSWVGNPIHQTHIKLKEKENAVTMGYRIEIRNNRRQWKKFWLSGMIVKSTTEYLMPEMGINKETQQLLYSGIAMNVLHQLESERKRQLGGQ